jgi:hypothetical protein
MFLPILIHRQLHNLRFHPLSLKIGVKLFFESKDESSKFFGLSLLRDSLSLVASFSSSLNISDSSAVADRALVRQTLLSFLDNSVVTSVSLPSYYLNSILTIITLCLKVDFPERWLNGFDEIIGISKKHGLRSADIFLGIMREFEIEVVAFTEARLKEEVNHNTLIKDIMRGARTGSRETATSTAPQEDATIVMMIVEYLCWIYTHSTSNSNVSNSSHNHNHHSNSNSNNRSDGGEVLNYYRELAKKSLICISELIDWVDVNLILSEPCLSIIYESIYIKEETKISPSFTTLEGLMCVKELLRKGMDSLTRLQFIQRVNLVPFLSSVSSAILSPFHQNDDSSSSSSFSCFLRSEVDDQVYQIHLQFALVVDLLFMELLMFWISFENLSFPLISNNNKPQQQQQQPPEHPLQSSSNTPGGGGASSRKSLQNKLPGLSSSSSSCSSSTLSSSSGSLELISSFVSESLYLLFPSFLLLLRSPVVQIAITCLSSTNKFLSLLTSQRQRLEQYGNVYVSFIQSKSYFLVENLLEMILNGLLKQSCYPSSLKFENLDDDEDLLEVIEVSKVAKDIFSVSNERLNECGWTGFISIPAFLVCFQLVCLLFSLFLHELRLDLVKMLRTDFHCFFFFFLIIFDEKGRRTKLITCFPFSLSFLLLDLYKFMLDNHFSCSC